jgi:hypothetical protein
MKLKWLNILTASIVLIGLLLFILLHPTVTYTYIQLSADKHQVNPDWGKYISKYDANAPYDFLDYSREQVVSLLGKPYYTLQKETKNYFNITKEELLIYLPYISGDDESTTAIYFDVIDGNILDYRVDDCLGIDIRLIPNYFN